MLQANRGGHRTGSGKNRRPGSSKKRPHLTQNAQIALRIAHYGYIMENGRIVFDGPAEKLRGNDDVREFYLGLSAAGRRKSFKEIKFYKRRKRWVF